MTTNLLNRARDALKNLSFAAQITGGVAGRDEALVKAIADAEPVLADLDRARSEPQTDCDAVAWYVWSSPPNAVRPICSVMFDKDSVTPMHVPLYTHPHTCPECKKRDADWMATADADGAAIAAARNGEK